MNRALRTLAPLAMLLAAGCTHALAPAEAPHVQLISASYPVPEIRAALVRALERRKLTAEHEEEGRVVARFQKKGESARLAIEYTATQFGVRYLDSSGMGETKDAAGTLMVGTHYTQLVAQLDKAIADELLRPAKEKAAAERHEREYQAMLQLAQTAGAVAEAQAADANAQAAADGNAQAQANLDAAEAQANAPPQTIINRTIVQNNVQNVRRNVVINNTARAPAPLQFCDKPAKAMWSCPSPAALQACRGNRGQCSAQCRVGGGC